MKIKQVCESTGLTDRAIRYYIEEGLVSPAFTENYMGRKAFDFSEEDVGELRGVAALRRFGFTVEEIRQLQDSPLRSQSIIAQVRERKQAAAGAEQETLALLDRLGKLTDYTVSGLAEALGEAASRAELPPERYRPDAYDLCEMAVKAAVYAAVMLAPLGFLGHWLGWYMKYHRYAVFGASNALCVLLALVPTGALLIAWMRPDWIRRRWRAYLLCLMYLPVSWGFSKGIMGDSMTTDIRYYRVWDHYVCENDPWLNALFPAAVRDGDGRATSIYTDSDYFYRARARERTGAYDSFYGEVVRSDHEVYAEWVLTEERLRSEIARVDEMFRNAEDRLGITRVSRSQQGDFTCWILLFRLLEDCDPFDPANAIRDYVLFAYDEATGRVRYGTGYDFWSVWEDFPHFGAFCQG